MQEYLNESKQVAATNVAEYETQTDRPSINPSVAALYITVGPRVFPITGLFFG